MLQAVKDLPNFQGFIIFRFPTFPTEQTSSWAWRSGRRLRRMPARPLRWTQRMPRWEHITKAKMPRWIVEMWQNCEKYSYLKRYLLIQASWVTFNKQCKIIMVVNMNPKMQKNHCAVIFKVYFYTGSVTNIMAAMLNWWKLLNVCLCVFLLALQDFEDGHAGPYVELRSMVVSVCVWPGHLIDTGREVHVECFVVRRALSVAALIVAVVVLQHILSFIW